MFRGKKSKYYFTPISKIGIYQSLGPYNWKTKDFCAKCTRIKAAQNNFFLPDEIKKIVKTLKVNSRTDTAKLIEICEKLYQQYMLGLPKIQHKNLPQSSLGFVHTILKAARLQAGH